MVFFNGGGFIRPFRPPPKKEKGRYRIIDRPRRGNVRLIDEEGEQVGIVDTMEALELAEQKGLDLVEIAPQLDPPTCRLMDYGKYKYEQSKKTAKQKKTSHRRKEIKMRPKIGQHDFDVKIGRARGFLAKGHKVLVTMVYRGREAMHLDMGRELLMKFAQTLEDTAKVEQLPAREGRNRMNMILASK